VVRREFSLPLHGVYVDLKTAFESLDRCALWKARQGIGAPLKNFNLLQALHCDTYSRLWEGKKLPLPFVTTAEVRQGCVLAPKLFCTAIDWIMNNMPPELEVVVGGHCFDDLY